VHRQPVEPGRLPGRDRGVQVPAQAGPAGMNREQDGAGPAHRGRDLQPVQDEVRGVPQDRGVLAAGGLALGAVAHDRGRAARRGPDGGELAAGREPRAAPARQPGRGDLAEDAGGVQVRRHRAVHAQVIGQGAVRVRTSRWPREQPGASGTRPVDRGQRQTGDGGRHRGSGGHRAPALV
jgi:hypothetical protein